MWDCYLGLNPYHYSLNNPLKYTDADELKSEPFQKGDKKWNPDPKTATPAFNCHGYVWDNGHSWLDYPNLKIINYGFVQIGNDVPNKVGDRVIWYKDADKDNQWDPGEEVKHSAEVTAVDSEGNTTEVTSKCGKEGMSTNHPDSPGCYNDAGQFGELKTAYFTSESSEASSSVSSQTPKLGPVGNPDFPASSTGRSCGGALPN